MKLTIEQPKVESLLQWEKLNATHSNFQIVKICVSYLQNFVFLGTLIGDITMIRTNHKCSVEDVFSTFNMKPIVPKANLFISPSICSSSVFNSVKKNEEENLSCFNSTFNNVSSQSDLTSSIRRECIQRGEILLELSEELESCKNKLEDVKFLEDDLADAMLENEKLESENAFLKKKCEDMRNEMDNLKETVDTLQNQVTELTLHKQLVLKLHQKLS